MGNKKGLEAVTVVMCDGASVCFGSVKAGSSRASDIGVLFVR